MTIWDVRSRSPAGPTSGHLAFVPLAFEHRSPYALRHTYATFAIAAGVSLFELARFMGTSVDQIDKTYGHLLPDALDRTRLVLDAFTASGDVAEGLGH